MIYYEMTKKTVLLFLILMGMLGPASVYGQEASLSLPRLAVPGAETGDKFIQPVELKNVPDFPIIRSPAAINENAVEQSAARSRAQRNGDTSVRAKDEASAASKKSTALRGEAASTTLPMRTRMKLVLESRVDAKESKPGDIFEAHVRDDLFFGANLLLPRGSLIRGRIALVNKPRIISRAGRIGLRLDQIVTPTGEVIPLDAALEFEKGIANEKGQLDPGTNFGTRVGSQIRAVSGADAHGAAKGALVAANVATLGVPTIATAIGGSAIALFRSGDNIDLGPGQEIEIVLTDNLGLQIN